MKNSILLICLWLAASHVFAQNDRLTVADVRQNWNTKQGTIESARISVRPTGLFFECGMEIIFSAKGTTWSSSLGDSLEIVLQFSMPEGCAMTDSWLWFGDSILKGHLIDRWSATNIYEGIVQRRTDPSILTRNSATKYELRVFPLHKNGTRKVRLEWLQPCDWSKSTVSMPLPVSMFWQSKYTVPQFDVEVWADDRFQNPTVLNPSGGESPLTGDPNQPGRYAVVLSPTIYPYGQVPHLQMVAPFRNGVYLDVFGQGDDGFYQMALLPGAILGDSYPRKLSVLLDYEAAQGAPTIAELLATTKTALLANLTPADSFNLFFSNLTIGKVANRWLPAHPDTIQKVFAGLQNPLSSYSNLPPLLVEGVLFAKKHGGSLMLLTNSTKISSVSAGNDLLGDLENLIGNVKIPIHIVDYTYIHTSSTQVNGVWYFGSGYFLYNLAGLTGGVLHITLNTQPLAAALSNAFSEIDQSIQAFDLSTSLAGGYCYGRFNLAGTAAKAYFSKPILQVGRYKGTLPFEVELNGQLESGLLHTEFSVPASEVVSSGNRTRQVWASRYIRALEQSPQTNSTVSDIVQTSLEYRVLSQYTAFLCVENDSIVCDTCINENGATATHDLDDLRDSTLMAQPNPFADRTTIVVQMPSATKIVGQPTLEIFDATGRLVRLFDLNLQSGQARMEWDGTALSGGEAAPGVYVAMLKMNGQTRTLKLVKVRP